MKKFIAGFLKVAGLPAYAHKMHLTMDPRKSFPAFSKKKNLSEMLKRRMK